jgi:hypothetical protein
MAAPWAVQLVGDRSESGALAAYRDMQRRHAKILSAHRPVVLRTQVGVKTIWARVRVEANNRRIAESLCSKLRAAGGNCLVQRN